MNNNYDVLDDHQYNGTVICPKPKRIQARPNIPTRPLRWKFCEGFGDSIDYNAGEELLEIIQNHEAVSLSPPPYFLGSPPVRASNPLIQDARFGCDQKQHINPESKSASAISSSPCSSSCCSPSSTSRKGGCARMKFGAKSAEVRVVGFDCQVPAVAY